MISQTPNQVAYEDPHEIGEILDLLGEKCVIVEELTRAQFVERIKANFANAKVKGLPLPKNGHYDLETREYVPMPEPGPEYKYFYKVEPYVL